MASIYDAKVRVVSVKKVSTEEEDKKNDGIPRFEVTAEVKFDLWGGTIQEVADEAKYKLDHALS